MDNRIKLRFICFKVINQSDTHYWPVISYCVNFFLLSILYKGSEFDDKWVQLVSAPTWIYLSSLNLVLREITFPARNNISNNLKVWHTYCSSILFSFSLTVFWKSARGKLSTCIYLCNYCLPLLVQNQQISGIPGT